MGSRPVAGDFAIAHTEMGDLRGMHCGIFYSRNDQLQLFHLALHLLLVDAVPDEHYAFVRTNLIKTQRKSISKLCKLMVDLHGRKVPYGFRFGAVINLDGTLSCSLPGDGFTCTSFVLAILKTVNITLVDEDTWPEGANAEWQAMIIQMIECYAEKHRMDVTEHVAALKDQGDAIRITPQEVAAAICTGQTRFDDLTEAAHAIAAFVQATCPALKSA